jgi:hypothetical protein
MLVEKAKGDLGYTAAFMLLASVGMVVCMPVAGPLLTQGLSASPWLSRLITRREKPEHFKQALQRKPDDIKAVIQFSDI